MSTGQSTERRLTLYSVRTPGPAPSLTLALPAAVTEGWAAIEDRLHRWYAEHDLRILWRTPELHPVETAYLGDFPALDDGREQRSLVGSALLRRIAFFHTVADFYRVQCWEDGVGWKIDARTAQPRPHGHDRLIQQLCHPRWGLPVQSSHRFCFCGDPYGPLQWGHTCSFYFDGHRSDERDRLFLRIHASPEGYDYDRQVETLQHVGAPPGWMARAFPQQALQEYARSPFRLSGEPRSL
ncbi:hypothetical protein ABT160_24455 [Streptomyces sp. NPDC001941]|uniref:hypothetical protein n=1 Tax=Streptomyces sp. NPDC001941 TaxID=3154659 RepID=UPI00331877CD